jgi:NADH:ubiquinone oxidoreductase subunit 4 (subunit M)
MCFGIIKEPYIRKYKDITKLEFLILSIFSILIIFFGLYPNCILNLFHDIVFFNIHKYILFISNNI